MMKHGRLAMMVGVALLCLRPADALAEPQRLSLSDAVSMAGRQNPQVEDAASKVRQAEAQRQAARGRFGPRLSVDANLLCWDSALGFSMPAPSQEVMAQHADVVARYPDLLAALPDFFNFGPIRDQVTSQVNLTLTQPITPLYTLGKAYAAASLGRDAAEDDLNATRSTQGLEAVRAYVGLMLVHSVVEISETAVQQVEGHLKQAKAFHAAGLAGRNDVLKAEVAMAEARERLIAARSAKAMAQSGLAVVLGLDPETTFVPTERFADPPPPFRLSLSGCVARASRQRPELRAMAKRLSQAEYGHDIAWWAMVPQVAAMANYQHTEGQGLFFPKDAWFAGAALKWDVWEWGATYYGIDEAAERTQQARIGQRRLTDGVYLEVKQSFLDLAAADETLAVARSTVAQAEENFRLEEAKFEAHANTSTDVLDAQLALTRTKLSYTTALFRRYLARAALAKAMGDSPAELGAEPTSSEEIQP